MGRLENPKSDLQVFPILDEIPPASIIAKIFDTPSLGGDYTIQSVSDRVSKHLQTFPRDEQYDGAARDELYTLLELKNENVTDMEIERNYTSVRAKWSIPKADSPTDDIDDHAKMRL